MDQFILWIKSCGWFWLSSVYGSQWRLNLEAHSLQGCQKEPAAAVLRRLLGVSAAGYLLGIIEDIKSCQAEVKASKSDKRLRSYDHLKICMVSYPCWRGADTYSSPRRRLLGNFLTTVHSVLMQTEQGSAQVLSTGVLHPMFRSRCCPVPTRWGLSRVVDPEKKAYLVRNKNPSVISILNDQNSSKWSLEGY